MRIEHVLDFFRCWKSIIVGGKRAAEAEICQNHPGSQVGGVWGLGGGLVAIEINQFVGFIYIYIISTQYVLYVYIYMYITSYHFNEGFQASFRC